MVDFLVIATKRTKSGTEVFPKFRTYPKSTDLMIRGGDFYAIWVEEKGLWSTSEDDALSIIDETIAKKVAEIETREGPDSAYGLYSWDSTSGTIDKWHKYCQKQKRDSYQMLDEDIIFANTITTKENYASKKLSYPLDEGNIENYNKLIGTLYSPEERHKLEWGIGAIVNGASKELQKFFVLYGSAGTGKSTILNIIQDLFDGYYSVFDAKALGSTNNSFALESFKNNPLVAIQHDGDLSRIEDNTRLNSLVSHELMTVNEKFKSQYATKFKALLFMGTNKPVKITDAKSGLIRRLIDVSPSGNKLPIREYNRAVKQIKFELGAIAYHCKKVFEEDPHYYDSYIPINMMGASNDFYNFIADAYHVFKKYDETSLKQAWEMYKTYCEDANVQYPLTRRIFKEELKNYFKGYDDGQFRDEDGSRIRHRYYGFKKEIFIQNEPKDIIQDSLELTVIDLAEQPSLLDKLCKDCPAQYASAKETPSKKWDDVNTTLKDIDTSKIHYLRVPENHIVIDFDLTDENGNKSLEKNLKAASEFPSTYAELSKGGQGIHLHYIYEGDVTKLSRLYADDIEIKVFSGKSSLRRRLSKCNNISIRVINSGLPIKEGRKMISNNVIKTESGLRSMLQRNMEKEFHPGTKPSIDFIHKILEDAYESGLKYDVSDMKNAIYKFAMNSTNQADYCIKLVGKMHFKSDEPSIPIEQNNSKIIFYDIEVFPNLFLVNWKLSGKENKVVRMINPDPSDVEELLKYRLIGFNCRRYDNHILYARMMGYSNEQLYNLSQRIINGEHNAFFGEAYNLSYTDVYDFASAGNKKSLKKLEVEMGITHKELGLPWNEPVPEEKWPEVAAYCDNDVIATEAAFNYLSGDWTARQILAGVAGGTVNDTTNSLTTKLIFGGNRRPQNSFVYRNLSIPVETLANDVQNFIKKAYPAIFKQKHGNKESLLPYFDGYVYEGGKSTYRNEIVGEGGYVYAEPGIYYNVAILDVASMHPNSAISECIFGPEYTSNFKDLVDGRLHIKHEDWDKLKAVLGGKLMPYVDKIINGDIKSKDLSNALKTAINSVYGLTAANFDNAFRDIRNKDNIVAKRGALFMIELKNEVQKRGFIAAHIKTDSIKIPNATQDIINFVMDFGKKYGYTFEHEDTYERMCLINDAVLIGKTIDGKWKATGTQFAVPYVFKTLFTKEPIEFKDMCETKAVTSSLYLDMNEKLPNVSDYEKELTKLERSLKKNDLTDEGFNAYSEPLKEKIMQGHDYHFIGKVGNFCPIKPGMGGGELVREKNGKYYSATGSKGYRWLESEDVIGHEEIIDRLYYEELVSDAIAAINNFGDFERFVNGD